MKDLKRYVMRREYFFNRSKCKRRTLDVHRTRNKEFVTPERNFIVAIYKGFLTKQISSQKFNITKTPTIAAICSSVSTKTWKTLWFSYVVYFTSVFSYASHSNTYTQRKSAEEQQQTSSAHHKMKIRSEFSVLFPTPYRTVIQSLL